ncbi:VapE domain-containing protein [Antarctobacter sp.]|uniref:VapE domain-containing protein n=1 Tax=Antarctobacter sp. TaxID=1872577 RepID=UPI002B268C88|nr:VapE domain-containing protein [Antarctobacter sp.]
MRNTNNLSAELQAVPLSDLATAPIWAAWQEEWQGDRWTKPPRVSSTRMASTTKPKTWGTRAAAQRRSDAFKTDRLKGLGIMLAGVPDLPGWRLGGIDLDGCRNPETGKLTTWAALVLDRFRSYADLSPGQTGVHVLFLCRDADVDALREEGLIKPAPDGSPGAGRAFALPGNHKEIALFTERKFLTVTGNMVSDDEELRAVDLDALRWLLGEHGPSMQAKASATGKGGKDLSGSGEAWRFLENLARLGDSEEEAREAIAEHDGAAGEWWSRVDDRQKDRAVESAFAKVARERGELLDLLTDDDVPPEPRKWTLDDVDAILEGKEVVPAKADWGTPIMRNGNTVINLHNTTLYLGRNLDSVLPGLARNMMTGRDEWRDGPLTDAAVSLARIALERRGLLTVGKDLVADAAQTVARKLAYHPIRDQLRALHWDGKPRLDSWLVRHAGADDSPYVGAVGRKFLIAMVARVMEPGCKHDHTLVLSGPQGQNKSTACRVLAGAEYFSDTLPSITGDRTDAIRHLQGKWLVELAELAPSRKSETEDLKAFLSGAVDRVRLPYARYDEAFARQCVFVGTTNEEQFLRDATGGRRFWPVTVGKVIDTEALAAERDQLFAEAFAAYSDGEPWWLDRDFEAEHAKPVQEAARESDSWAEDVSAWLDCLHPHELDEVGTVRTEVTISEVLGDALQLTSGQHTRANQNRAAAVMRDLGWVKKHTRKGKMWCRGDLL